MDPTRILIGKKRATEEKQEPKPCPFCGSKLVTLVSRPSQRYGAFYVVCECYECGASTKAINNGQEDIDDDWENSIVCMQAIERWNRRFKGELHDSMQ